MLFIDAYTVILHCDRHAVCVFFTYCAFCTVITSSVNSLESLPPRSRMLLPQVN